MKTVNAVFQTDRGRIRAHNEDSGGVFPHASTNLRLAVVADGMGGHNAGDIASRLTIEALEQEWNRSAASIASQADALHWFQTVIPSINESILAYAFKYPDCSGMGTTLVAAICTDKFCTIASIGDSRCYLQSESGLSQITEDHSFVNELVKSGEITREAAESHPKKHMLTRALGAGSQMTVDYRTIAFEEGDFLLLCSDGLSNKLSQQEIEAVLLEPTSLFEKAAMLIRFANESGGEDNITVVIMEHGSAHKGG